MSVSLSGKATGPDHLDPVANTRSAKREKNQTDVYATAIVADVHL